MMTPEQILEHAQRGRGRRRAPLLHGHAGPGAVQARLREHPRRARGSSPSTRTSSAAPRSATCRSSARRRSRRPASSACTTTSRRPRPTTPRSPRRSATRAGCARSTRSARPGLETCVGGILNLGESREQRVEMAFQLAEIDPTSVPINLLNPRPGTKFGDRDYMDPWEAVKWIAIFRLILPSALFRLCGGRVENLGELQPLAVKAGLNGVMMGNFLTTLGSEPEDDRAMFEELGLNVARQDDNGANPRPDNRSGWLEGETPRTPIDELVDRRTRPTSGTRRRSCATARRPRCRRAPTARRTRSPRCVQVEGRGRVSTDIEDRLEELRDRGLYRKHARWSPGRRARACCSTASRSCCSARTTTSGSPTTRACARRPPRPRCARASAPARRGWCPGNMTIHRRLEERLRRLQGHRGVPAVRLGLPRQRRASSRRSRARATSSSPTRSTTPRSSTAAGSRGPRRSSTTTATWTTSSGACARPRAAAR